MTALEGRVAVITGAGRGIGREHALLFAAQGASVVVNDLGGSNSGDGADAGPAHEVVAEIRAAGGTAVANTENVATWGGAQSLVQQAIDEFGRLDVVVNNAGYSHFGMVEEVTEEEAREQLETNLFGPLWITQAALPIMREDGGGRILQVSSVGGVCAFPSLGLYHASKWALEGMSEALAQEVADFGVAVTVIEPGPFSTDWGASARFSESLAAYEPTHRAMRERRGGSPDTLGDPVASAAAVLRLVDAEDPPLRLFLGDAALAMAEDAYAERLAAWREWQPVAELAQGTPSSA